MNVKLKNGTIVEAEMTVLRKLANDVRESKDGITLEVCFSDKNIADLSNIFTNENVTEITCTTATKAEKIYTQFNKIIGMSEIIDEERIRVVVKLGTETETEVI